MTNPFKQFDVTGRLELMVQVTVKAESLEDALDQSRHLTTRHFVLFKGEFMDGSLAIIGVSRTGAWDVQQGE